MGRSKKVARVKVERAKPKIHAGLVFLVVIVLLVFHGCIINAQHRLQARSCNPVKEDKAQYAACMDNISYGWILTKKTDQIFHTQ